MAARRPSTSSDGLVLRTGQSLTGPPARSYVGVPHGGARLRARLRRARREPVLTVGAFGHVADISVEGTRPQPAGGAAGGHRRRRGAGDHARAGPSASTPRTSAAPCCPSAWSTRTASASPTWSTRWSRLRRQRQRRRRDSPRGPAPTTTCSSATRSSGTTGTASGAYQALHNVVIGGIVDRNGRTGARLVECSHTTVVGQRLPAQRAARRRHAVTTTATSTRRTAPAWWSPGVTTNSGPDDDDAAVTPLPRWRSATRAVPTSASPATTSTGRTSAVADRRRRRRQPATAGCSTWASPACRARRGRGCGSARPSWTCRPDGPASAVFDAGRPGPGRRTSYRLDLVSHDGTGARGLGEAAAPRLPRPRGRPGRDEHRREPDRRRRSGPRTAGTACDASVSADGSAARRAPVD